MIAESAATAPAARSANSAWMAIRAGKCWFEGEAMSADENINAVNASDVRVTVDGESIVLETCAHRSLNAQGTQS